MVLTHTPADRRRRRKVALTQLVRSAEASPCGLQTGPNREHREESIRLSSGHPGDGGQQPIVIGMGPDPEPDDRVRLTHAESPVAQADAHGGRPGVHCSSGSSGLVWPDRCSARASSASADNSSGEADNRASQTSSAAISARIAAASWSCSASGSFSASLNASCSALVIVASELIALSLPSSPRGNGSRSCHCGPKCPPAAGQLRSGPGPWCDPVEAA
jgi:hypothetical protein